MTAKSRSGGHAIVTGGSSGIGAAVVDRLLARDLTVTVLDLQPTNDEGRERVRFAQVDVTDQRAVHQAMTEATEAAGVPTYLVTSHGIRGAFAPALDLTADGVRRVLDVHVIGTLNVACELARQAIPAGQSASIVTISSTTAYGGWANQADYGVAKAAVRQLTENLAIEWAPRIRVNGVAPGHTLTPMVQEMIDQGYDVTATANRTPLGRLAQPEEMAAAIEHLLLDATFTTGVCIPVDGGWTTVGK